MMKNYYFTITKAGKIYNIPLEYERKKRKSLVLRVYPHGPKVLFSMPLQTPQEYSENFLQKQLPWLQKQLEHVVCEQKRLTYENGDIFYYLGHPVELVVKPSRKNKVTLSKEKIILATPYESDLAKKRLVLQKAFTKKLEQISESFLAKLCFDYRDVLDVSIQPELKFRQMTRKWGICRPFKNQITLNKSLIHVDLKLIEYVLAHELCHFKYLNHSKSFWSLLQKQMPDCFERRECLNKAQYFIDF